jgi:hypothetical protein
MPHLEAFRSRATWFDGHRSAVPSVTRVCGSTFATGCHPAAHGLEGNTLALLADDRFTIYDAGRPDFLAQRRAVTSRALDRPSLAARLAQAGGIVVFSNVSPGAAYVHDPDQLASVYHRAGSFGPGGEAIAGASALNVTDDLSGDRTMTDRFIRDVVEGQRPALALLWLGHPDTTQHAVPLGSPEHLAALRAADENAARVIAAVDRQRQAGDDIMLIVGSDHGHQTVHAVVDVEEELRSLGFSALLDAGDLVVVPNGTACLVYARASAVDLIADLAERVAALRWAGAVYAADALAEIGQSRTRGLALFVSMASDDETNAFGVRGRSYAAKPLFGKADRLGCGQHGGLGAYEQSPVLMIDGEGFAAATVRASPSSLVDIAPTILKFLQSPADGMDGRPQQGERTA